MALVFLEALNNFDISRAQSIVSKYDSAKINNLLQFVMRQRTSPDA
jgi:hypothetical protein